jgi:hypothetical protein
MALQDGRVDAFLTGASCVEGGVGNVCCRPVATLMHVPRDQKMFVML